jgi:hypothetical protein
MSEKTKFWVLLGILVVSIALVVVINTALGQQVLVHQ